VGGLRGVREATVYWLEPATSWSESTRVPSRLRGQDWHWVGGEGKVRSPVTD